MTATTHSAPATVTVTFVEADGTRRAVAAAPGATLMQAGVANGVAGIVGECGGSCMCATCHVVAREEDAGRLPPISPEEEEMLDFALAERRPGSRLGCQIAVTPALDGLTVAVPG